MNQLRVLIVCEQPTPDRSKKGRGEILADILSARGHQVKVLCPRPEVDEGLEADVAYEVEKLNAVFNQYDYPSRLGVLLRTKKAVAELVRKEDFDIVRTVNLLPTYTVLRALQSPEVPVVGCPTDIYTELIAGHSRMLGGLLRPYFLQIEGVVARGASCALLATHAQRKHWASAGLDQRRSAIIPYGLHFQKFAPVKSEGRSIDERKLVLHHGHLAPHRGLAELLEALAILKREGNSFGLLVIGSGPNSYLRHLKQKVKDLGLQEETEIKEWVPYSQVPLYIAKSEVCAMPYRPSLQTETNFDIKSLEYAALGKKILCSQTAAFEEVFGNLVHFTNPRSVTRFAHDLKLLLDSPLDGEKKSMLVNVAKSLDWERIVEREERLYEAIVAAPGVDCSEYDMWGPSGASRSVA